MNQERSRVESELDAAFATVQAARLRHEMGYENAHKMARECVISTAGSIHKTLSETALSPAQTRLIQAKLRALTEAAARIPAPVAPAVDGRPAANVGRAVPELRIVSRDGIVKSRHAVVTPERDPIVLRMLVGLFTIALIVIAATVLGRR